MNFYQQITQKQLRGAHRGSRALRPENTLAAFEAAVGHFDFIELDIQPARDGTLMILHDDTMERTTNIDTRSPRPRPHRIGDYDVPMLQATDAGSWFARRDPFGTIAAGLVESSDIVFEAIPTLSEVLALCHQHRMPLNIEIKDSPAADSETLLIDLLKTLAPYREASIPLLISSFNHRYLARLHQFDTTLDLAANVEHSHPSHLLHYLQDIGVIGYHVEASLIGTTPVAELTDAGITCAAFTLNNPEAQSACFDHGFRAVFADMTNEVYWELQRNSS